MFLKQSNSILLLFSLDKKMGGDSAVTGFHPMA
jgi:hypothetical protein